MPCSKFWAVNKEPRELEGYLREMKPLEQFLGSGKTFLAIHLDEGACTYNFYAFLFRWSAFTDLHSLEPGRTFEAQRPGMEKKIEKAKPTNFPSNENVFRSFWTTFPAEMIKYSSICLIKSCRYLWLFADMRNAFDWARWKMNVRTVTESLMDEWSD